MVVWVMCWCLSEEMQKKKGGDIHCLPSSATLPIVPSAVIILSPPTISTHILVVMAVIVLVVVVVVVVAIV